MGKKALVTAKSGDLTVIAPLQRRLNPNRVRKLVKEWDSSLVGTLEVAELEYEGALVWHITDGQTRWEAAMIADPDFEFTAVVEYDLDAEQVARLFIARNQLSAKVPAFDQYEVGLVAKDKVALAVRKALNANKLKAGTTPDDTHVAAVAAMMAIVKKGMKRTPPAGAALLTVTLATVKKAWPDNTGSRFNGDIVKAIGGLHARFPNLDSVRLEKKLAERSPEMWTTDAKALSTAMSGGGEGRATLLQSMFREAYNHRLGKDNKLS